MAGYRKYYGNEFDEKEVENLIMMADSDGSGNISYQEFMMTCVNQEKFLTIQRLESIFHEIDLDKNHRISLDELNQFLGTSKHLDKKDLAAQFQAVDPDGVGEITFDQFQKLIENMLQ